MEGVKAINRTVDVVHDEDAGRWYLQEYALDGKGTTRISQMFLSADDAVKAYDAQQVDWQEWD